MTDYETKQKHVASFSFVVLMVLIVLPVWWKTTEVYGASFPPSSMEPRRWGSTSLLRDI